MLFQFRKRYSGNTASKEWEWGLQEVFITNIFLIWVKFQSIKGLPWNGKAEKNKFEKWTLILISIRDIMWLS